MIPESLHPEEDQMLAVALGVAEDEARARVERHVESCADCARALVALRTAGDEALAAARPSAVDSARMLDRLMASLPPSRAELHLDDAVLVHVAAGGDPSMVQAAHLAVCSTCAEATAGFRVAALAAAAPAPSAEASARMKDAVLRALDEAPAAGVDEDLLDDAALVSRALAAAAIAPAAPSVEASARMMRRFEEALAREAAAGGAAAPAHVDDAVLVGIAAGEEAPAFVRAHLDACGACAASLSVMRAAHAAAAPVEPSPFVSARIERNIARAIDGETRAQRFAWQPSQVFAAVVAAAFVGAGSAAVATGGVGEAWERAKVAVLGAQPAPAVAPMSPLPPERSAPVVAPQDVETVLATVAGPDPARARAAADELGLIVRQRGDEEAGAMLDLVDGRLAGVASAEAMRVRCELLLRYRADQRAVEACQAFVQTHPAHPDRSTLEYATGRLAEKRLQDGVEDQAADPRSQLLAEYTGLASTEALLDRARCRSDLGDVDLARADLRLFLLLEPGAAHDREVMALAKGLGVAVP